MTGRHATPATSRRVRTDVVHVLDMLAGLTPTQCQEVLGTLVISDRVALVDAINYVRSPRR